MSIETKYREEAKIWTEEAIWGHRFCEDQTPWAIFLEFLAVYIARELPGKAFDERLVDGHESFECSFGITIDFSGIVFKSPHINLILNQKLREAMGSGAMRPQGQSGGGGLLYLMLNRSRHASQIAQELADKLFSANWKDRRRDALAEVMGPGSRSSGSITESPIGFLPTDKADLREREYNKLAETWLGLLRLDLAPDVLLDHLVRLTGLHLLNYIRVCAADQCGKNLPAPVLVISPSKHDQLVSLSGDSFRLNRWTPRWALSHYVLSIKETREWEQAEWTQDPTRARRELIDKFFSLDIDIGFALEGKSEDEMLESVVKAAKKKHDDHFLGIHGAWAEEIGLLAKKYNTKFYSAGNSLLNSLVVGIVDEPMEFREFLRAVSGRFGLVIGERELRQYYGDDEPIDYCRLPENAEKLERKLNALGLLRGLSDDCAYVLNPFSEGKRKDSANNATAA